MIRARAVRMPRPAWPVPGRTRAAFRAADFRRTLWWAATLSLMATCCLSSAGLLWGPRMARGWTHQRAGSGNIVQIRLTTGDDFWLYQRGPGREHPAQPCTVSGAGQPTRAIPLRADEPFGSGPTRYFDDNLYTFVGWFKADRTGTGRIACPALDRPLLVTPNDTGFGALLVAAVSSCCLGLLAGVLLLVGLLRRRRHRATLPR